MHVLCANSRNARNRNYDYLRACPSTDLAAQGRRVVVSDMAVQGFLSRLLITVDRILAIGYMHYKLRDTRQRSLHITFQKSCNLRVAITFDPLQLEL